MTIDAMMAEIRKDHPDVWIYEPRGEFVVRAGRSSLHPTLGRACERYEAVYSALKAVRKAVRKARPKPMTVAEAKAFVRSKRGNLFFLEPLNGVKRLAFQHGRKGIVLIGEGDTEGQAWKAAAAAIQASEGKS